MLDNRLQNDVGAVPPKCEPRSRIGMYLGHSPFHAGRVALVCNPTTSSVSSQYHIVFDNEFSNVPYMEAGTILLNWGNIVKYSSEMATAQDVDLEYTWLRGQFNKGVLDPISDLFTIVTDHN